MREKAITRRWLPALLLVAALLRAGFGWVHPPPHEANLPISDPDSYVRLGYSVADSWSLYENGLPSAHREPAYPVLLGLCFKVFGRGYGTVLAANVAMSVASVWLLFLIASDLYDPPVAGVAALISAFYPPFVYYAAQCLRETALAFFVLLALYLLIRAYRRPAVLAFLLAGAAAATAALTKTTFLPFGLIVAPAGLAWLYARKGASFMRWVSLYVVAFLCLYGAWPIRNYRALGVWVMGSTEGAGDNLYLYQIIPQEMAGTPEARELMVRDEAAARIGRLPAVERERMFLKAGLGRIRQYPAHYLKLVAWRFFVDFWRILPRPRPYAVPTRAVRLIALLTDGWIIPLGFAGMLLCRLRAPEAAWLYLFTFSECFVYSLIFTSIRYRFAVMPILILYAATVLCRMAGRDSSAS